MITPYSVVEIQDTTASAPEEEVVFDYLSWDEQSVMQYITSIHFFMQSGNVSGLKTKFSSEGLQSYAAVYNQLHTYDQSVIQQVVLDTINKDNLIFSTRETLSVNGVNMQYDNQYTLSHPEKPTIEFFSSVPVQQDIQADEYALGLFMKNYRGAYKNAINQGEFALVEGYFFADGAVYREIKEYIQKMSKDNVHFDFGRTEVTGKEILEQIAIQFKQWKNFYLQMRKVRRHSMKRKRTIPFICFQKVIFKLSLSKQ